MDSNGERCPTPTAAAAAAAVAAAIAVAAAAAPAVAVAAAPTAAIAIAAAVAASSAAVAAAASAAAASATAAVATAASSAVPQLPLIEHHTVLNEPAERRRSASADDGLGDISCPSARFSVIVGATELSDAGAAAAVAYPAAT